MHTNTHTLAHYCLRIFSPYMQMRFAPISAFQLAHLVLPTANKSAMNLWRSSSKSILKCMLKNAWKQLEGIACTQTLHMVHAHRQKQVSSLVLNYRYCFGINNNSLHNYVVEDKFCVMLSDGTERCIKSKKKTLPPYMADIIIQCHVNIFNLLETELENLVKAAGLKDGNLPSKP